MLLLQIGLVRLLLLLPTVGVLQDGVEVSVKLLGPLADLRIELQVLVLLPEVVFSANLLLYDRVLVDADGIAELTRALPFDLYNPLGSDIDPRMVRLQVEQLLLVGDLLQAGQFPLLIVYLVLHELLY